MNRPLTGVDKSVHNIEMSVCLSEHVSSLRRLLDKKKKRRSWTSRRNVTVGWISSGNCLLLLFLLQYKGTGHPINATHMYMHINLRRGSSQLPMMETDGGHPDVTSSRPVGQVLSRFELELNLYHRAPQLPIFYSQVKCI